MGRAQCAVVRAFSLAPTESFAEMPRPASLDPLLDVFDQPRPADWGSIFRNTGPLEVEIGFGLGEVLLRKASDNPGRNYIGIEENWERIYKTLKNLTVYAGRDISGVRPGNVRILAADARQVFRRLFAESTVDHIYCLFPCPWPKKAHAKHRLFSSEFLRLLNSRLKSGAALMLVTDFRPYADWIISQNEQGDAGFDVCQEAVLPRFATKFEKKWRLKGQKEFHQLLFYKRRHMAAPVLEDCPMKAYKLLDFIPDKFVFADHKSKGVSVIFKSKLYDPQQKEMVVLLTVAEGQLTQHVRVSIVYKEKFWRVMRADGQKFFPTPGVVLAVKLAYEAAEATLA